MTTQSHVAWIPVTTSAGMFSSEYAVSVPLANGQHVTLFADRTQVKEEASGNFLLKVVVVSSASAGRTTALLPTEAFETSSRWVEVVGAF